MINKVGIISVQPRFSNSLLLKNHGNKVDFSENSRNLSGNNSVLPVISDTVTFCGRTTPTEILQGVLKNKIINSNEFAAIKQMRKNVIDAQSSCKKAIEQIKEVFGDRFMNVYFERSLKNTDDDILKDVIERRYFFDCNKDASNCADDFVNPKKFQNVFCVTPHYAEIDYTKNKINIIPDNLCKIYFDGDGRYLKVKGFSKEYEYINPEWVSEKTPRITTIINNSYNHDIFQLSEYGGKNKFAIYSDDINKDKKLVIEFNPETKVVSQAYTEDVNTKEKSLVTDINKMSELARKLDFVRLSEKDYTAVIKGIVREVLF